MGHNYVVYKCGGDITGSAESLKKVKAIILSEIKEGKKPVLVVSGMRGSTDALEEQIKKKNGASAFAETWIENHTRLANQLGTGRVIESVNSQIREAASKIESLHRDFEPVGLEARIRALRNFDGTISPMPNDIYNYVGRKNEIIVQGERFIGPLIEAYLKMDHINAELCFGTDIGLSTNNIFGQTPIQNDSVRENIEAIVNRGNIPLITGYDARFNGNITTLGRSGSDKTATFLGLSLGSKVILLKGTDGVMSADPKRVSSARHLPEITYKEAAEAGNIQLEAIQYAEAGKIQLCVNSLDGYSTQVLADKKTGEIRVIRGYQKLYLMEIKVVQDQPGAEEAILDVFRRRDINKIASIDSLNSVLYMLEGNKGDVENACEDIELHWKTERVMRFGEKNINGRYVELKEASLILAVGTNMSYREHEKFVLGVSQAIQNEPIVIGGWRKGIVSTYVAIPNIGNDSEFNEILKNVHDTTIIPS